MSTSKIPKPERREALGRRVEKRRESRNTKILKMWEVYSIARINL
jgi:hypothetical protein